MAGVAQPSVERQHRHEADEPQGDPDLHGPHAVDVQRLDVGDQVGTPADRVLHRLVVAELHAVIVGARPIATGMISKGNELC